MKKLVTSQKGIHIFVIGVVLLFTLGQLGRLSLPFLPGSIYGYELGMMGALVLLVLRYRWQGVVFLVRSVPVLILLFLFMTAVLLFTMSWYTPAENMTAVLYLLRILAYAGFFSYFYLLITEYKTTHTVIKISILVSMIILLCVSVLQFIFFPDLRFLLHDGWDPHLYRMTGVFFEPAIAGALYGGFILYTLSMRDHSRITYSCLGISAICLLLTLSRAGVLSFVITFFIYIFVQKKQGLVVLSVMLGVGVIVLGSMLPRSPIYGEGLNIFRTSTILSRVENYKEAVLVWEQSPVVGNGYNRISAVKEDLSVPYRSLYETNRARGSFHSSWLIVLVTTGVTGLSMVLYLVWQYGRQSLFHGLSMVFLGVFSLFDNIILHPFVLFFFVLAGIVVKITHLSRNEQ